MPPIVERRGIALPYKQGFVLFANWAKSFYFFVLDMSYLLNVGSPGQGAAFNYEKEGWIGFFEHYVLGGD